MKATHTLSKNKKIILAVLLTFLILFAAGAAYVNDYYRATKTAYATMQDSDTVTVEYIQDDVIAFIPEEVSAGFIFYPGGKVEYTAYAPLLHKLAENNVLCILPHMTCNLAVLEMNAADGLCELYPGIDTWYIGGHSLGGSMAASYLEKHTETFAGLILCASYSTADLSATNLDVLSIYGSNDLVLNAEKYEENKTNLPSDFTEHIIEGGCHAYFGSYGAQKGDGVPTITEDSHLDETINTILNWINEN